MVGKNTGVRIHTGAPRTTFSDVVKKFLDPSVQYVDPSSGEYTSCATLARDVCFARGVEDKGEEGILARILKEYLPIRDTLNKEEKNTFILEKAKQAGEEVQPENALAGDIMVLESPRDGRYFLAVNIGNGRAMTLFTDANGARAFPLTPRIKIHAVRRIQ